MTKPFKDFLEETLFKVISESRVRSQEENYVGESVDQILQEFSSRLPEKREEEFMVDALTGNRYEIGDGYNTAIDQVRENLGLGKEKK